MLVRLWDDLSVRYFAFTALEVIVSLSLVLLARLIRERVLPAVAPLFMIHKIFTYYLDHYSGAEAGSDEQYDTKQYAESALIYIFAVFGAVSMRPKVDFFVTLPLALGINIVHVKASYTQEDGNMDCFTDPENFTAYKLVRFNCLILIVSITWWVIKKHKVNNFLQQIRTEKQQICLTNIFEQQ